MSQSSPFPSCFRPSSADAADHLPPPPPPTGKPNLTTCFYQTQLGVFSLTWSRSFLTHSLHLHLLPATDQHNSTTTNSPLSLSRHPFPHSSAISFHLHIKPFVFWKKHGSKTLHIPGSPAHLHIFWDLSRAKFASGPEPLSGFYIAAVVDRQLVLLVGDLPQEVYVKTRAKRPRDRRSYQSMVLRREQVFGNRVYTTKARFGGANHQISIDCSTGSDARLSFSMDNKRILQIKRLKWKFRGNERVEVGGVPIQISWDVYNWLFEDGGGDAHAVFMFRFEKAEEEEEDECDYDGGAAAEKSRAVVPWRPQEERHHQSNSPSWGGIGMMLRKGLLMKRAGARSSSWSSISMSSASSMGTNSSVMEWASVEESELSSGPTGFSLLVYAWKK